MSAVTQILERMKDGDDRASEDLLPLVYEELQRLAKSKLACESPGQTLQTIDLVHEAYVRLVDVPQPQRWNSRGHFFAAAAEAMRRILVERARRKKTQKHGGNAKRVDLLDGFLVANTTPERLLDIDEAMDRFKQEEPIAAQVVMLRVFAAQSVDDIAKYLDLSPATIYRHWAYARAWLRAETSNSA